jgi:hypothetical protein
MVPLNETFCPYQLASNPVDHVVWVLARDNESVFPQLGHPVQLDRNQAEHVDLSSSRGAQKSELPNPTSRPAWARRKPWRTCHHRPDRGAQERWRSMTSRVFDAAQ